MKLVHVSVALAMPQRQDVIELSLPEGSTAGDAVREARRAKRLAAAEPGERLGIWSRPCDESTRLRDGDRVEIYRPLRADAKAQRRERARLKTSTRSRGGS
jgi:putative ubiquitin-RnfH superfamily antitoxin RatB of RatAB toxin-antitoxin module